MTKVRRLEQELKRVTTLNSALFGIIVGVSVGNYTPHDAHVEAERLLSQGFTLAQKKKVASLRKFLQKRIGKKLEDFLKTTKR